MGSRHIQRGAAGHSIGRGCHLGVVQELIAKSANLSRIHIQGGFFTADLEWGLQLKKNRLAEKDFSGLCCKSLDLRLCEVHGLPRLGSAHCICKKKVFL